MDYLAGEKPIDDSHGNVQTTLRHSEQAVKDRIERLMKIEGHQTAETFHKKMGKILYNQCGLVRKEADLLQARSRIEELQQEFYQDLRIPGDLDNINFELEKAARVEDYLQLALLIIEDALQRKESCGAHFREEFQTSDGEAKRNDKEYQYVSAWESTGNGAFELHKEPLEFKHVEITERSYQ
jgi:succinate dehydrogenase / fumarate reductase flavoprotein subunit